MRKKVLRELGTAVLEDAARTRELLESDATLANEFVRDGDKKVPLLQRAITGPCVELLLEYGARPLQRAPTTGFTAAHAAVAAANEKALCRLLFDDDLVEARDARGDTPLHLACRLGARGCARELLGAAASIKALNLDHKTPKDLAAKDETFLALLQQYATPKPTSMKKPASLEVPTTPASVVSPSASPCSPLETSKLFDDDDVPPAPHRRRRILFLALLLIFFAGSLAILTQPPQPLKETPRLPDNNMPPPPPTPPPEEKMTSDFFEERRSRLLCEKRLRRRSATLARPRHQTNRSSIPPQDIIVPTPSQRRKWVLDVVKSVVLPLLAGLLGQILGPAAKNLIMRLV